MIKLKSLVDEIERANQTDASRIYWEVKDTRNSLYIVMFIKGYEGSFLYRKWGNFKNQEMFGALHLSKNREGQRNGYLVIYNFEVEEPLKGYGALIFKKALEKAKELGYDGIASQREFRSLYASRFWNKFRNFSDEHFDYSRV